MKYKVELLIVITSNGKEVKLMSTNKKRRKQNRQIDLYKIFELLLKLLEIIFTFIIIQIYNL